MLLYFQNHDGAITAINMSLIVFLEGNDDSVSFSFIGNPKAMTLSGNMAKAVIGALRKHGLNADVFSAPNETSQWPTTDLFSSNGDDEE